MATQNARVAAAVWLIVTGLLSTVAHGQWVEREFAPRSGVGMAYDSGRGVIVAFGGEVVSALLSDTWEWDGTAWRKRAVTGPSPRGYHAMAYDAARGVTVLFGGRVEGGPYNGETWEWDGVTWTQRPVQGPAPRWCAAMAYDPERRASVLFGGEMAGSIWSGETWEWDGNAWLLRTNTGPSPRYRHEMTYDSARRVVLLHGGSIGNGDVWEWDGGAWSRVWTGALPNRFWAGFCFDDARGVAVLFAGKGPDESWDTWTWDGESWYQRALTGPPGHIAPGMAFHGALGRAVAFGGRTKQFVMSPGSGILIDMGETWSWDGAGWERLARSGPRPVMDAAMAYDPDRGVTVLAGGDCGGAGPNGVRNFSSETWEFDGTRWEIRESFGPSVARHAMVFDSVRRKALLYGGLHSTVGGVPVEAIDQMWEWDGVTWTLLGPGAPGRLHGHAMCWDTSRNVAVLFGGTRVDTIHGETWEWNGAAWSQRTVSGPSPRSGHAMAYDSDRGVAVLFGGTDYQSSNQETWEWNGQLWSLRSATGPAARGGHKMFYDRIRHVTTLYGGYLAGTALADVWDWDGAVWAERQGETPGARHGFAAAYDSQRDVGVIFGGYRKEGIIQGDTWESRALCDAPIVGSQPQDLARLAGETAVFTVGASGSNPLTFRWRKDGVDLEDGPFVSGSGSAVLTLSQLRSTDAGRYACLVSSACGSIATRGARLGVACYADCDPSTVAPVLNINDFMCFLNRFAAGDPYANCDGSTSGPVLNVYDFVCFQERFAAGCN